MSSSVFNKAKAAVTAKVNGASVTVEETAKTNAIAKKAARDEQAFSMKVSAHFRSEAAANRAGEKHQWARAKRQMEICAVVHAAQTEGDKDEKRGLLLQAVIQYGKGEVKEAANVLKEANAEVDELLASWENL